MNKMANTSALGANAPERLQHESAILARLAGVPGVPQLSAAPHSDSAMALEDVIGQPLSEAISSHAPDVAALLGLALQLAQTIAAMHRRGVLHLNINPRNIVLCGMPHRVVLTDFHLAVALAQAQAAPAHRDIPGDLAYVAPEQTGRTGRKIDHRADLYALGATLYEVATGRLPFEADDPLQLIHDHLTRLPTPPAVVRHGLPRVLSEIILRLLEKEPDRRYQTAEGLAFDLARLRDLHAKGSSEPFELGERDFPLRLSPPARLINRQPEIAALRRALDEAMEGKSRVALVAGAPGVGKTSLINELRPMVTARRGWFVSGKFDQYRHDAPTATVQALRALGRLLLAEPQAEAAERRARILAQLGPNAGLITAMLPEFAPLLGVQPEIPAGDPMLAETRLRLTTMELLRTIVSPVRPLVIVLDDLQWAGVPTIRFIEAVLARDDLQGLLVVGAYRDAEVGAAHPLSAVLGHWQQRGVAPLVLKNLAPAGLGELLREMLRMPRAQAAALAQAVGVRTGGNPFDTVELVNALRHDGALAQGPDGWEWDSTTIHRYIGKGDVIELVGARIAQLPTQSRDLLEAVACLGGEVGLSLLQAATGLSSAELEEQLAPPVEDGLLVREQGGDSALRLQHDRVQQAAYGVLTPARRTALHLSLARQLASCPEFSAAAAQQYLPVVDEVKEPQECRLVVRLLQEATVQARRSANYSTMERLITVAMELLLRAGPDTAADEQQLAALEIERHAVLYSLGRLDEADAAYQAIEGRSGNLLALVDAGCVQVCSLGNRSRMREAIALGLTLLRQLGLDLPEQMVAADIEQRMDGLRHWVAHYDAAMEQERPDARDPRVVAAAQLMNRLQVPAFFCDMMLLARLVLESQRLWAEHGPCAALVANLSRAGLVSIWLRQDYRTGYDAVRHVVAMSEARGYEPQTSQARHVFANTAGHWFEPLESCVDQAQRAREGLLLGGDLQNACFTYRASVLGLLECAPTLDSYAAEIESGLAFAARTGNDQSTTSQLDDRQLLRALRGQTDAPGSFVQSGFDDAAHLASLASHPLAVVTFHIRRALAALLFSDIPALLQNAAAAMPWLSFTEGFYPTAHAYLLQALALAERVKAAAAPEESGALLAEMDACRDWLACRAADAPVNFLHLLKLVDAERAWAVNDFREGARMFDAALREVQARQRPWHKALITERAGLFHLEQGMESTGEMLIARARRLYEAWGASAKVEQLEENHGFLRAMDGAEPGLAPTRSSHLSADSIDMLALLRASQALSSETSLAGLKTRVVELLGTMTGATSVLLTLHSGEHWLLAAASDQRVGAMPVEEAGRLGLLPLSAFHYAVRTMEPLLVEDAAQDDRFARDPYIARIGRCSLLAYPIMSQGVPRAMLLLENRQSRGAFSAGGLDTVVLIAGQLTVSLENALLYQELEQRVQQRTAELRAAQAQLVATARQAGMAEIATNVLHNVGNTLNSVNVSAGLLGSTLRASRAPGLARAVQLMDEHAADLDGFLTRHDKGRLLPAYLGQLAQALAAEQQALLDELGRLTRSVDHIKEVVATQQSYAGSASVVEPIKISDLVEDALRMGVESLARHRVTVVKEFAPVPLLWLDRTRVLQILVNLIGNAKNAMENMPDGTHRMTLSIEVAEAAADGRRYLRVQVRDEGEGISADNLTRIFAHGFTTRQAGHGFGLHSCALAARQMGGTLSVHSDGLGRGATFTLELPIDSAQEGAP
jgi:predicted ATPase/signal transduction histidine kinase